MYALKATDLTFSYEEGCPVINNINLAVSEGEYVCMLGRNGSGKSTLARLVNGLLIPTKGKMEVFGLDSGDKKNLFEIRKTAGMVFQNPDNQMVASVVEDDIAFGPENIGVPPKEIGERIDSALKAVGMEEYRRSTPTRLSGGQKQRIAIAGVLALRPRLLILDESTSMLDPRGRREVTDVIKRLNKEEGMTVINITHYMDEAVECDRAVVVSDGKIAADVPPRELFRMGAALEKMGLGMPKAAYIAQKLNFYGVPVGDGIMNAEELWEKLCELLQKG